MNTSDPIDQFRQAFFDKVIKQEKEAVATLKRKQLNCWHKYMMYGDATALPHGYIVLTCSKCGHSSTRHF
jgi:hypothetical protein